MTDMLQMIRALGDQLRWADPVPVATIEKLKNS